MKGAIGSRELEITIASTGDRRALHPIFPTPFLPYHPIDAALKLFTLQRIPIVSIISSSSEPAGGATRSIGGIATSRMDPVTKSAALVALLYSTMATAHVHEVSKIQQGDVISPDPIVCALRPPLDTH